MYNVLQFHRISCLLQYQVYWVHQDTRFQGVPGYKVYRVHHDIPGLQGVPGYQVYRVYQDIPAGLEGVPGYTRFTGCTRIPGLQGVPGYTRFTGCTRIPGLQGVPGYQVYRVYQDIPAGLQGVPGYTRFTGCIMYTLQWHTLYRVHWGRSCIWEQILKVSVVSDIDIWLDSKRYGNTVLQRFRDKDTKNRKR